MDLGFLGSSGGCEPVKPVVGGEGVSTTGMWEVVWVWEAMELGEADFIAILVKCKSFKKNLKNLYNCKLYIIPIHFGLL